MEPQAKQVQVRGVRLNYMDWGGNGPALLFLHGDQRTSRSWDAVARELGDGFHTLSLDARGHGDSDWTPRGYRIEERVADLAAFFDALKLRDVVAMGHSTGAAVLAMYTEKNPGRVSRLALVEPLMVKDAPFNKMVASRSNPNRRTWPSREDLFSYLRQHPQAGRWREDVIEDVAYRESYQLPDGSIDMKWSPETFNAEERETDFFDLRDVVPQVNIPMLFILGDQGSSQRATAKALVAATPQAQLLVIEGGGHNVYMERPDLMAQALTDFVAGKEFSAGVQ